LVKNRHFILPLSSNVVGHRWGKLSNFCVNLTDPGGRVSRSSMKDFVSGVVVVGSDGGGDF